MKFATFMQMVDSILIEKTNGFNSADLPDFNYWDCFEAELTPLETALDALEYIQSY